jgi:thioredoxin reductase
MRSGKRQWDVIIVGAGPAGTSAALILGRCCRQVLICDAGTPRSWAAREMHSFLSRDGIDPNEFRTISRNELSAYPNVRFRSAEVTQIRPKADGTFEAEFERGVAQACRKVLLATGVLDQLPAIPGIEQFFGTSVHQCPYCDGWEMKRRPIAVYGKGQRGFEMARAMTAWSSNLMLCSNGRPSLSASQRKKLRDNNIELVSTKIELLVGQRAQLKAIRFTGGRETPCEALFFDTPCYPQSPLAKQLGCRMTASGGIYCGEYEASSVPGVYAAGNILKDVQLSIVAAAEGARAAFGVNRALTREDFARRACGSTRGDRPHE